MKTRSVKWGIMAMALLSMAMPFTAKAQDKVCLLYTSDAADE